VQTPKPALASTPLMAELGSLLAETGEMLEPLARLGIPRNSLKDKLPHFREDHSALPNTVRPRVQKVLRANIQYAEELANKSREVCSGHAIMGHALVCRRPVTRHGWLTRCENPKT
jgi:hypothetical protein